MMNSYLVFFLAFLLAASSATLRGPREGGSVCVCVCVCVCVYVFVYVYIYI